MAYKVYIIALLMVVVPSNEPVSVARQEGLVLSVQTTANTSSQSEPSEKLSYIQENPATEDENIIEEIHSSFEDVPVALEEVKSEEVVQSEASEQFQHRHVNIATELSESGQAAVVYTLVDTATSELQNQAAASVSDAENSTGPVTIPLTLSDAPQNESHFMVQDVPDQDILSPPTKQEVEGVGVTVSEIGEESNDTVSVVPPAQEDIPSFSEWAQKQLAEAEKKKGENMTGGGSAPATPLKVRHSKNYASPDCGAKVVGANPEAVSAGSVLSSSRDEYLLNTCNARIWFIVELCEAIQPKKIEMANFELFSSSPRELSVWLSDRYPTRDWALAGRFTAQDERNVQTFNLSDTAHFGKYVKVEVHSHYGQEHYCPVSLFRVYGTSEIEVLDTVDEGLHPSPVDDDDDDLVVGEGGEAPKNLFGSARDAVLSIVKKAAEALAKSPEEGDGRGNSSQVVQILQDLMEPCITPSHIAVCVNCSDDYYHRMYQLMSCRGGMLQQLLSSQFVHHTVSGSEFCAELGLDLRGGAPYPSRPGPRPRPIHYLHALLPSETLAALCNLLAVAQKKVVLNVSEETVAVENRTVLDSTLLDEPTPELGDVGGNCKADSNTSEELATRPPFQPPQSPTLPIQPSPTLRDEDVGGGAASDSPRTDTNLTLTTTNNTTTSMSSDNSSVAPAEHVPLVVEDSGSLDSLFSELEQAVVPSPRVPPQKESVFVRLANRIKALERNMSLSGQYLEELSRRYKRQVEEMTRALAGAVEDRRRGEERENQRLEQVAQLSQQVEALTVAVKTLLEERDSWQHKATVMGQHGVIVVVEVLVFAIVLYVCRWLPDVEVSRRKFSVAWPRAGTVTRRKSVDELLTHLQPLAKRRRPSEEALVIAGSTHQELLIPEARRKISKGETRRQRRKKKRELSLQAEVGREETPQLLDRNSTESVAAWWEEEVFSPMLPAPPPPRADLVTTAPRFVQTAVAQRQDRIARTSSDINEKTFLPIKKTGPFKKIVKKFF